MSGSGTGIVIVLLQPQHQRCALANRTLCCPSCARSWHRAGVLGIHAHTPTRLPCARTLRQPVIMRLNEVDWILQGIKS